MKLTLTLLLCMGMGLCYAQTPFRHLQHNNKLRTSAQQEVNSKTIVKSVLNTDSQASTHDLHPVRLKHQKIAQQRNRRRQRSAPEHQRYSSQDLYLEIRKGEGMEKQKAQNRKMWSGK
ncbi:MAG: hypothetical protein AB8H47_28225 [Bacteroidia bacterium]